MADHTLDATVLSSIPDKQDDPPKKKGRPKGKPKDSSMTLKGYSHDAYRVLGENYLIRVWLPKKGPYFVALVQAMRAHIYWDFQNGNQQTTFVPEAATIAAWSGMSRSKVFMLLADPDMEQFVYRVNRRRHSPEQQREVQTSNLYYVMMEDPPANEFDKAKVERQQRRITLVDEMRQGKIDLRAAEKELALLAEQDEAARALEANAKYKKTSESTSWTLSAVHVVDPQSSTPRGHEDRMTINYSDEGLRRSAEGEEGSRQAIRKPNDEPGRGTTRQDEGRNQQRTPHTPKSKSLEPDKSAGGAAGVPAAAVLSESETWIAQARAALATTRHPVTKHDDLEHQLEQFGTDGIENAVNCILSHHAKYLTPVELLPDLAQIARTRTANRDAHIYESAAGYFIKTLCNLAAEARRVGYDLTRLRKTTAKAAAKELPPVRAAHAPAAKPSAHARPATWTRSTDDYDANLRRQGLSRG